MINMTPSEFISWLSGYLEASNDCDMKATIQNMLGHVHNQDKVYEAKINDPYTAARWDFHKGVWHYTNLTIGKLTADEGSTS